MFSIPLLQFPHASFHDRQLPRLEDERFTVQIKTARRFGFVVTTRTMAMRSIMAFRRSGRQRWPLFRAINVDDSTRLCCERSASGRAVGTARGTIFMRIDRQLCQKILIAVEDNPAAGSGQFVRVSIDGYEPNEIAHHIKYLFGTRKCSPARMSRT